jgi:hypothetical protein
MGLDFSHGDLKGGLGWDRFLKSLAREARLHYDSQRRRYRARGPRAGGEPLLELLNAEFDQEGCAYICDCGRLATRVRELVASWDDRASGGDGRKELAIKLAEALEEAENAGEVLCMWW